MPRVCQSATLRLSVCGRYRANLYKSKAYCVCTGEAVAPYFAIGMLFFLMLFVAYFVLAVVSIIVDFDAMDAACAEVFCFYFSPPFPGITKLCVHHLENVVCDSYDPAVFTTPPFAFPLLIQNS